MASKRRIRRNACGSKKRYETEREARNAIIQYMKDFGKGHRMCSYRCKFCGGFHIGHRPSGVK